MRESEISVDSNKKSRLKKQVTLLDVSYRLKMSLAILERHFTFETVKLKLKGKIGGKRCICDFVLKSKHRLETAKKTEKACNLP
jgi:hypothetical protein